MAVSQKQIAEKVGVSIALVSRVLSGKAAAIGIAADTITDFQSGEDLIVVDLVSFGIDPEALGLLSSGLVSDDSFVSGAGARALDADDYFIFDTAQGTLLFDADGSGDGEAVVIAEIDQADGGTLTAGDVFVGI